MRSLRPLLGTVAVALSLMTAAAPCEAQELQVARDAYDRGTRAFERGDFAVAARDFALADALAPHAVALKWALTAALRSDDAVLGMTLVERSKRAPLDAPVAAAVAEARAKFARRVGAVKVRCRAEAPCQASIDRVPIAVEATTYVTPGAHAVELVSGGKSERRIVEAPAGGAPVELVPSVELAPAAPVVAPAAPRAPPIAAAGPRRDPVERAVDRGGIHPGWFWASTAVTAGLAAVTIASGVDALAEHDAYLETRTPGGDQDGRAAQGRTNVLIGVTGVVALTTLLIGVFAVDWGSTPPKTARRAAALSF